MFFKGSASLRIRGSSLSPGCVPSLVTCQSQSCFVNSPHYVSLRSVLGPSFQAACYLWDTRGASAYLRLSDAVSGLGGLWGWRSLAAGLLTES